MTIDQNKLRRQIESLLPRDSGFVMMIFPFTPVASAIVCSNCPEEDYLYALRELLQTSDANHSNGESPVSNSG